MNLDDALQTFILESRDLLDHMESALLEAEHGVVGASAIDAIFRAAHTIKGSAGLFGLGDIVEFTHIVESVLDRVRDGRLTFSPELVSVLLTTCDHLSVLISCVADNQEPSLAIRQVDASLVAKLNAYLPESDAPVAAAASTQTDEPAAEHGLWYLSMRCGPDVLRNGMDPVSILRYLGTLGAFVQIVPLVSDAPTFDAMDPEVCYLGFECLLSSAASAEQIDGAFDFIRDDAQIAITPPESPAAAYFDTLSALAPADRTQVEAMLARHINQLGALEAELVAPPVADVRKKKAASEKRASTGDLIRVNATKLDQHINLIGELIITSATVSLQAQALRSPVLMEVAGTLSRLVEEIRDSALQLRMVPIGATFNKFQRVVRDVANDLGKDIHLEIAGADTELDKTVVEKLGDPLTHLVRNAMDHGIESAEMRLAQGKPAQGTVKLNAYHDSGSIIIEVSDDGGGLDRQRILAKAIERGLTTAEQHLTDSEVFALIFEAGLSTADQVSNISGRGVGMDVVHRNITALRGSVEITSEKGVGTTMRIRMPLTLAIIDGFMVTVSSSTFVIPLAAVVECIEFTDAKIQDGKGFLNLRGAVLPLIHLAELFNCPRTHLGETHASRENIVVIKYAGHRAGLVVDSLLGEFQTVIRPLGEVFAGLDGLSGFTVLGSGQVAPILDVQSLIHRVARSEERRPTAKSVAPALSL